MCNEMKYGNKYLNGGYSALRFNMDSRIGPSMLHFVILIKELCTHYHGQMYRNIDIMS